MILYVKTTRNFYHIHGQEICHLQPPTASDITLDQGLRDNNIPTYSYCEYKRVRDNAEYRK